MRILDVPDSVQTGKKCTKYETSLLFLHIMSRIINIVVLSTKKRRFVNPRSALALCMANLPY